MNDISDNNERYKKKKGEKIKPKPSDSNPKVKGDRGKKNKSWVKENRAGDNGTEMKKSLPEPNSRQQSKRPSW